MCQIENNYVQVCMHVCDSIKGHGQVLDHAIVQVIKHMQIAQRVRNSNVA